MQKLGWFGGYGSPKVIGNITIEIVQFLFDFNRNYVSILYRFRVIGLASYLSKVANYNLPHLRLAPS